MTSTPVHDEDTVCAAIATSGTEYVEATPRSAAKSVGWALARIAAAVVVVGLGAAAGAAFLVVPQPPPAPPATSISVPWRWHAQ
jgi:hypothetical protein